MKPTVFVCAACGKIGETRETVGDESCFMNAVECWRSSVIFKGKGRATFAVVASEPWVEPRSKPVEEL